MYRILSPLLLFAFVACSESSTAAAQRVDAGSYLQQHGWKAYDTTSLPRSPVRDVVPLMFYDKGNSVPSCGVLTGSATGKAPVFIELVGSDPGAGFPQCLSIAAITPFKLQNKEYVVVEYLSRETREDIDRHFHYLVRNDAQSFVTDKALTEAAPVVSTGKDAAQPASAKPADGVRFARQTQLSNAQPAWHLLERDLISDKSSSFTTFEGKTGSLCQFVTEAGATPVVISYNAFAPSAKCDGVLASSRIEKSGKIYYLAMFRTDNKKQMVGVTSVAPDGHITVEKALSESINGSGMTSDMKTAKAALIKKIR